MTDTAHESTGAGSAPLSSPTPAASDEHRQAVQLAAERVGVALAPVWAALLAELVHELEARHTGKSKK